MPRALELGSGQKPAATFGFATPGDVSQYEFTTVDLHHAGADVKWDLTQIPWPFPDGTFDAVVAIHVLEHLRRDRLIDVFREIHRVTAPGGSVLIRVPYWASENYVSDPTHMNPFSEGTFGAFSGGADGTDHYVPQLFDLKEITYVCQGKWRWVPRPILRELTHHLIGVCAELRVVLVALAPKQKPAFAPARRWEFERPVAGPPK